VSIAGPIRDPSWRAELPLALGALTGVSALLGFGPGGAPSATVSIAWSLWIVMSVVACAMRAMAHADRLAERFGEPAGTVVLTVAAITIEVAAVCAMMLGPHGSATAARDSMFAVIMLILNGLVAGCMIIGARGGRDQRFNPESSSAFLPLIVALGTLTMVLPRFCDSTLGGWMSDSMEVFIAGASIVVYAAFLWMQVSRYRDDFAAPGVSAPSAAEHSGPVHVPTTIALLVVSLLVVVLCAEAMAGRVPALLEAFHLPPTIGGVLVAAMVLCPEGLAALRASAHGDMQRSINVLLGSALATIGLTVPAVLVVGFLTSVDPELGLEPPFIVLLALTFLVSSLSLMRGRVNAMHGVIHLLILFGWIMTILDEALLEELP
jgi:Ca2+:H+ antiporter